MEKRKWLWKRKSSEKGSCETESSGSISSHSERYSDEQQEALKGSPDHNTQSPEVSSNAVARTEGIDESPLKTEVVNDSLKILTEKLSAALVNVSAKEDLVKQHAKVAEEAVAGWEKAENEVAILKQQLEAAVQQKSALENRVSHLDGALKECVRQLRQARDEQELKVHEAVSAKTLEWDSIKCVLESRLLELQNKVEFSAHMDPDIGLKLEFLEKENSALRLEIHAQMEELEVRTIERDLSTQAAETASKQHLESIKKVAKLEAECRRLKAMACKSPLGNDHKSTAASSIYVESFTDSHSDSGDRLNTVDASMHKVNSLESNKRELNLADSWASALIAELDQFKNEKNVNKSLPNSSVEINLMDDFLEMERLAALQPTESGSSCLESDVGEGSKYRESVLRAELEAMIHRTAELEQRLERLETEKAQLEACASRTEATVQRAELEARIRQITELEERLEKLEIEKAELEHKSRSEESYLRNELKVTNHRSAELEEKLGKLEMEKAESENEFKIVERLLKSELEAMIYRTAELEEKLDKLETEKADLENKSKSADSVLRSELEVMVHRTTELEEKLEKLETEKGESENESKSAESVLRTELKVVIQRTAELEEKIEKLETEKAELENESKSMESVLKTEFEVMIHRTAALEEKLEKLEIERADLEEKLEKLETENAELEETLEKLEVEKAELEASESKHGESVLRTELAMIHKTAELEEKLETLEAEKAELKATLAKSQECMEASQLQVMEAELKLEVLQRELKIAKESKQTIESQLINLEAESRTVSKKASILEEEVQRERALSEEIALRCQELEDMLSTEKEEVKLWQTASSKPPEKKIKQEDFAVAAGKLAECQKTMASLRNQLKSLATLEDFLIDAANLPEFTTAASLNPRTGEQWKLHSNHTFSPKRDTASPTMGDERSFVPSLSKNHDENFSPPSSLSSSSSTSAMVLSSNVSSEKNRNGFAKFFSRTKSGIRLEI